VAEQCAILFIKSVSLDDDQARGLRSIGFRVAEAEEIPSTEVLAGYHAIIVRAGADCRLTALATHLRAKPKFDRRVLIALVCDGTPARDRRDAIASGFDGALSDTCSARDLAATILRLLRPYPEHRCLLRAPNGRRKAA
jgi:hypothetical protein